MKTSRNILAAASALAFVSGCSVEVAENQTGATSNEVMPAEGNMAGMANDPNNPFAEAEMQMHERMMAATGANASESWVKKMIEHHRGAVAMSSVLIGLGGEEPAVGMARKIVADQGKEIQELERMVQAGGIGAGTTGDADPYKQSDKTMHDRMMAATGSTPTETWIRKMIEHHRGAVDMSNILIAQGGDAKVLEKARATVSTQQKEMTSWNRCWAAAWTWPVLLLQPALLVPRRPPLQRRPRELPNLKPNPTCRRRLPRRRLKLHRRSPQRLSPRPHRRPSRKRLLLRLPVQPSTARWAIVDVNAHRVRWRPQPPPAGCSSRGLALSCA
jgi:uncharacterized protein (DUF305 family)